MASAVRTTKKNAVEARFIQARVDRSKSIPLGRPKSCRRRVQAMALVGSCLASVALYSDRSWQLPSCFWPSLYGA